tara:strand:+ start:31 stop:1122 length:1092 start_codon:yes stop_codon:yes gene_type:complete
MKRFKHFLEERRRMPIQVRAFLDSRAKPYEYWMSKKFNLPFPLSKPMMNRLGRGQENVRALHSTDADGLDTLISLQNTAKSISVFTRLKDKSSGDIMVQGVETDGGVIVELEGDIAFKGDYDIFTSADNQGRRWLDLQQFSNPRMGMKRRMLIKDWHNTWMNYIVDFTRNFIRSNRSELMEVYNRWIDNYDYSLSYMDHLDYATKTLESARLFWIGGQGYRVTGIGEPMSNEESLRETGIVQKIQIAMVDLNHPLVAVAKRALFQLTKGLFDLAEKFFSENAEEFQKMGQETADEKGYTDSISAEYDEAVMQNYTIKNVYYNTDDSVGPEVGEDDIPIEVYRSGIEPIAMGAMDWEILFQDWI